MKTLITSIVLLFSSLVIAESTTVRPFRLEFAAPEGRYHLEAKLTLSCRYERLVFSDSSEYNYQEDVHSLPVKTLLRGGQAAVSIELKKVLSRKLSGTFRSSKGCRSELMLTFTDKTYAVGWAGQMSRPIQFKLGTSDYYRSGDSELDVTELSKLISHRFIDFYYRPVPGLQVNIWLTADGTYLPVAPTSSAIDPTTGMPYLLE